MIEPLHPAIILLLGSLLLPLLPNGYRKVLLLALPVASFINLLGVEAGMQWTISIAGFDVEVLRTDKLSMLFGYLFHLAAFLSALFAFGLQDRLQQTSGLMYAGAAVLAVFAGDLIVLFVGWELLALTSVFQIWARRNERARGAGMRYLMIHISSGLLLLVGTALHYEQTGSLGFGPMPLDDPAAYFILLAFGIKCAFPLLHNWLIDAYPEATPTGAVFLSAFTTKVAIYALARSFAGVEALIWVGAVMTIFPIFYAMIENDLRRVLGYSMINQLGFMVVGVGLGEGMGVNGAVAHAFTDVIFKGLLFMSMGAVLFRTGRINGSDLGGLYKSMPITTGLCIVGAASISAFPLFSGFVSKTMVMAAAVDQGHFWVWLILLFASAGVLHHAGIKIPFFAFFAHDSGIRCKEAPSHMLVAMGLAAALCVVIGSFPQFLYSLLPYPVTYKPYTTTHILTQLQLLLFSVLGFTLLQVFKLYPPELRAINLESDYLYRRLLPGVIQSVVRIGTPVRDQVSITTKRWLNHLITIIKQLHTPDGILSRTWLTNSSVQIILILLSIYLLYYLLQR